MIRRTASEEIRIFSATGTCVRFMPGNRFCAVVSGWVVQDSERSDRFLWDFRRPLSEMLAGRDTPDVSGVTCARLPALKTQKSTCPKRLEPG